MLKVLILSGHMTREHDNEFRSFRSHNQWLTSVLEDTGLFRVRVVENPRGLGAGVIDKYDVVLVVFEGRDGYHEKATGFGAETDAALLKFVREDGKGMVWFHGSAVQEDDWGYPAEYNTMRGATLSVPTGLAHAALPGGHPTRTSRWPGSTITGTGAASSSPSATTSTRSGALNSSGCSPGAWNGRRPGRSRWKVRTDAASAGSCPGRTTTARAKGR